MAPEHQRAGDEQHSQGNARRDRPHLASPSISLPIIAMLGGMCGEPVSVALEEHPADLAGAILRLIRDHVPDALVHEVFRPADLRRLGGRSHETALVLVYPTPGHLNAGLIAQWQLERNRRTRLPMILIVGELPEQDLPGAVLRLRIGPLGVVRLRESFTVRHEPDPRVREFLSRPWGPRIGLTFDKLQPLFNPGADRLWTPQSLRSVQTLRGLLAGHCLWRRLDDAPGEHDPVAPDAGDYAGVRELLARSRAGLPGETGDRLLAAMIKRANLHLEVREQVSRATQPILTGRDGLSSLPTTCPGRPDSARVRPIGLCELADLGNVRSALATRLIEAAMRAGDLGSISALGLVGQLPDGTTAGSLDGAAIARLMVTWSMKQVRTRFDRLRRQGFVEAERLPAGNGPWVIQLPEELKSVLGEFQGLPAVGRVAEACRPPCVHPA